MVPRSTLIYGSSFISETETPWFLSSRPSEATVMPLPTDEATPPVTKMNFDIDRILLPHSLLARYGCASPSLNPGLCHKMPFTRLILIACRRELPLPAALLQDDNLRLLRQAVARDHKLWLRVDGLDAHLPAELVERLKVGARTRS